MDRDDKLTALCSMTELSPEEAANLLDAADGDLETAVQLHFADAGSPTEPEHVRAPIAPTRGRIQEDYDDYGRGSYHHSNQWAHGARAPNVFPQPFADNAAQNPGSATAARLAQLYRPPLELMHDPPAWEAARLAAVERGVPLLTSLLDPTLFACHVANRDIWSNEIVRQYVRANAVFLQIPVGGEDNGGESEGDVYAARYRVRPPHVGLIDPVTRELLYSFPHHPVSGSLGTVEDFLSALSERICPSADSETDEPRAPVNLGSQAGSSQTEQTRDAWLEDSEAEPPKGAAESTAVMFRLLDGKRVPRRFYLSDTLSTVHRVARALQCQHDRLQSRPIVLRVGTQVLEPSDSSTVQEAGLANSLITLSPASR